MLIRTATLACGPTRRLIWHPQGRFLAARQPTGAILADAQQARWHLTPYRFLGPWSPDGARVLTGDEHGLAVRAWPSEDVERRLPALPWFWMDAHRLMAVFGQGVWQADADGVRQVLLDPDGRWRKARAVDPRQVVGLRWRPSLREIELATWGPSLPLPQAMRLPELAGVRVGPWAWAPSGSAWAAVGGERRTHLWAWTFPQGWTVFEREAGEPILSLAHHDDGLAWLTGEGLYLCAFADQTTDFAPLQAARGRGGLAWQGRDQQLAAAAQEGIQVFRSAR